MEWSLCRSFQFRKPPYKARRESRGLTSEAGRALACARYERTAGLLGNGEVSGKNWLKKANHFQQKKIAYGVALWNSRRGRQSSTRRTSVLFPSLIFYKYYIIKFLKSQKKPTQKEPALIISIITAIAHITPATPTP